MIIDGQKKHRSIGVFLRLIVLSGWMGYQSRYLHRFFLGGGIPLSGLQK